MVSMGKPTEADYVVGKPQTPASSPFSFVAGGSVSEELLSIVQMTTVKDYRLRWEMLASRVPDVPDHVLEGSFVRGLQENIKVGLHILQPMGLANIMDTAQRLEEGHQLMYSGQPIRSQFTKPVLSPITPPRHPPYSFTMKQPGTSPTSSSSSSSQVTAPTRSHPAPQQKPSPFRWLSESEYQDKKTRGICFRCDKKFHRDHECDQKFLQVLLFADDEDVVSAEESPPLS